MNIVYTLTLPNSEVIYSLLILPNNSILVGAYYNSLNGLIQYKINKDGTQIMEYSRKTNNVHTGKIFSLEKMKINGNWKIITGSGDKKLKIWA